MVGVKYMEEVALLQNSFNSKEDCSTQKSLFPITSAIASSNDSLIIGVSSVLGNYWTGGLGIYKWDEKSSNFFGGTCNSTDHGTVEDITTRLHSFASFEASVSSITVLTKGQGPIQNEPFIVGLDDGSLQLITMPTIPKDETKQSLTIDSATYHDWPIERVLGDYNCLISMDSAGSTKSWDLERFVPVTSWSIGSATWPCGGQALEPDLDVWPRGSAPGENPYVATLAPCDPVRQLSVWDVRVSSVRRPCLHWSHVLDTSRSIDLPRSVAWLSSTLLLVGTYQGLVQAVDIRRAPSAAQMDADASQYVFTVDTRDWSGSCNKSTRQTGANQVLHVMVDHIPTDSTSTRLVGLIGPRGSLSVCEMKLNTSAHPAPPGRPLYHSPAATERSASSLIGLRRAGGLFLPRSIDRRPVSSAVDSGEHQCKHWNALVYSGLPELNVDRDVEPQAIYSGLPRLHSGPWGGPWGSHKASCPEAGNRRGGASLAKPYFVRCCSDPIWSTEMDSQPQSHFDTVQSVKSST